MFANTLPAPALHLAPLALTDHAWVFEQTSTNIRPLPPGWCFDMLQTMLAGRNNYLLMLGEQRIGFISWRQRDDVLHLSEIQIVAAWQKQGYGNRAIDMFENLARQFGHWRVSLHVSPQNKVARSIYHRRGYKIIEHQPDHIFMEKLLSA